MSGRLFAAAGDFARFDGTLPLTAAPFTILVAGELPAVTGSQYAWILTEATTNTNQWRLGCNSSSNAQFNVTAGSSATAATTNTFAVNTPFTMIESRDLRY